MFSLNFARNSSHSSQRESQVDTVWRPLPFSRSDVIVFVCGIAGALFLLGYYSLIDEKQTPWDRKWMLAFPWLWSWLLPLAIALLADMRSVPRWVFTVGLFAIILPVLSALSVWSVDGVAPFSERQTLLSLAPLGTLVIPVLLGFLLIPLVRTLDKKQPLGNYSGVFRAAWRIAGHTVLASALTLGVVILLFLGASLFELIGLPFLVRLFEKTKFRCVILPVTFAVSLICIQRRPQLVLSLQRAWFTLNGWILPLVSLLGVTFTIALAAQLAFGMRASTLSSSVLIIFAAVWIILVNATWQDGPDAALFEPALRRVLRWSLVCLLPLSVLALYNVLVRVDQYGWTVARVWAAFTATLAVIYSVGYVAAALRVRQFYAMLAFTNYLAVLFAVALLMAFSTPVLEPRRVMVDSQTQRLLEGRLSWAQFDFQHMAFSAGSYGRRALQRLADGAANDRDPKIADSAKQALAAKRPFLTATSPMPFFTVYPLERQVPPKWWAAVSKHYLNEVSACINTAEQDVEAEARAPLDCVLIFADLSGKGQESLILYVPTSSKHHSAAVFMIFSESAEGDWRLDGSLKR